MDRIAQLLRDNEVDSVTLDYPFEVASGEITEVCPDSIRYSNGESDDYEVLTEDEIDDLAYEVERQLESDEKIFLKSQGL